MKKKLLERKYNEDNLNKQMEKVDLIERKVLLQNNEKGNSKKNIPLVLTYNRMIPNISEVVRKNWHILQINTEFRNMFVNKPTIAFKRNKNTQDLIGGYLIKDGKVAKKKIEKWQAKSKTCNTTRLALRCMQMINTNKFRSNQTKRVFNIYHFITCKSQWIIYLLKCILCNIQTSFKIRLNNHRKDVSNPKPLPACVYSRKEGHNFIQYAKFTLIEQLTETANRKCY